MSSSKGASSASSFMQALFYGSGLMNRPQKITKGVEDTSELKQISETLKVEEEDPCLAESTVKPAVLVSRLNSSQSSYLDDSDDYLSLSEEEKDCGIFNTP